MSLVRLAFSFYFVVKSPLKLAFNSSKLFRKRAITEHIGIVRSRDRTSRFLRFNPPSRRSLSTLLPSPRAPSLMPSMKVVQGLALN